MTEAFRPESRPNDRYRGRFAPSPTGSLHLGSLLAALSSFLQARSRQGHWLLRIDDLDPERSIPTAADQIKRTLERFGLCWDGEACNQRNRIDRYRQAFDRLLQQGLVYGCDCSRRLLTGHSLYPGYCRTRGLQHRNRSHAMRLNTSDAVIHFTDRLHGRISHDLERETGDFVIRRRDGVFGYHLATVVDDADAAVTEVVRGADLLDSTPRQIHLQNLLKLPTPAYCHTPVLVDVLGQKLSKQSFAAPVAIDQPGRTLYRLLRLLRQDPSAELELASPAEILGWAIAHWDITRLNRLRTVQLDPDPGGAAGTAVPSP